jgi:6-pyruvoyltetrahydropterin/6-carboxytetrahydropterin synthase
VFQKVGGCGFSNRVPDCGWVMDEQNTIIIKSLFASTVEDQHDAMELGQMELFNEFFFHSAHFLPNLPNGHKCKRLHGHTYKVGIYINGDVDERLGWVVDFADIARVARPVIDELDHRLLNELEGLENPTSENIARWIWQRLKGDLPKLSKIVVSETNSAGCIYSGDIE